MCILKSQDTQEQSVRAVWLQPSRRVHLDWYDGPIQTLLTHPDHGTWYLFATSIGAVGDRIYAMLLVADSSMIDELSDIETRDDTDWLAALGRDVLLPACASTGVWVTTRDHEIKSVRPMTDAERQQVRPQSLQTLLAT